MHTPLPPPHLDCVMGEKSDIRKGKKVWGQGEEDFHLPYCTQAGSRCCGELLKEMSCLFEFLSATETFANHLWFFKNLGATCEPFLEITYVHLCYQ